MDIDAEPDRLKIRCPKCGRLFDKYNGFFPPSNQAYHTGTKYVPYCRSCVQKTYDMYLSRCGDPNAAIRACCRKFDMYYDEKIANNVILSGDPQNIILTYMVRLRIPKFAGKSYDDNRDDDGTMWNFGKREIIAVPANRIDGYGKIIEEPNQETEVEKVEIPQDVLDFWGAGCGDDIMELEARKNYWVQRWKDQTKKKEVDIGTEALIRQISICEITINKELAGGRSVDKIQNTLNNLLGSLNVKPVQQQDAIDSDLEKMPLGVGIEKWEYYRPIPPAEKDLQDINDTAKLINTFYLGHMCKMAGVKNYYSRAYEEAMEEYRVQRPDIISDDDEEFLSQLFDQSESDNDGN